MVIFFSSEIFGNKYLSSKFYTQTKDAQGLLLLYTIHYLYSQNNFENKHMVISKCNYNRNT